MTRSIDTNANISRIRLAVQGSNPSNPPAGYYYLFVKSGGIYILDSSGTETGPLIESTPGGGSDFLVVQVFS